jgi:hypothetical protein
MTRTMIAGVGILLCASIAFAEGAGAANPLGDLPSDVQLKIAQLGQILAGAVQDGRLTDAQIYAALSSGDAPAMIRSLGPQAAQLLQDIAAGFKGRYTEDELNAILGGLMAK